MNTIDVRRERLIAARPEVVWSVLTDLENATTFLSGVESVEVLTPGPYAVGTRWRETRSMLGMRGTEEMQVVEVDAPHRTTVTAAHKGTQYRSEFLLEPVPGDQTKLTTVFGASSPARTGALAMVGRALGALGMRVTTKAMDTDLADIAAEAERRAR
ncbi:SRPBCC family protein [Brachybacterium sp. EF45031]|uniref:SRPBCC family protein n=1 Tax=Brachybacterium sillae TaxID=2810536 RepID=UPI00217DFC08|nr:SRPBCC family protein [Brachybacterium sillae]MCS6711578.1 SRPBCC family protein [Brachybacterium sillae]